MEPFTELQEEVRSLSNTLKSTQALESQTSEREAQIENKCAKVFS